MHRLRIQNFAQISDVSLDFGDLTILVGAQGTGKSLALQWLKTALDGRRIVNALRDAGQNVSRKDKTLVDLIFGAGMGEAWNEGVRVTFDGKTIKPDTLGKAGKEEETAFFIPAHRAMLISDGWAAPFQRLTPETPVVARLFSQNLFDRFNGHESDNLFPQHRVLKKQYRDLIDDAVFHGGTVGVVEDESLHTKRLRLIHGASKLPFMTWTAGQREFTPLLLGLYHLLPPRKMKKQPHVDWVIIEEPEMGLHPKALSVFMLLVIDLLWRGYRVVLSTHSPIVLTVAWMLRRFQETGARWQLLCDAFGATGDRRRDLQEAAKEALKKDVRTYLLAFGEDGKVRSKDISSLDPGDESDDVSGWGGLTGFSSRFADAVRQAVNEQEIA